MAGCKARSLWAVGMSCISLMVAESAQAAMQVTQVRLAPTTSGVELRLNTTGNQAPQVFTTPHGNTWQADLINTQLAPNAGFEQANPAPGIKFVSVVMLDANSVRVTIVGSDTQPTVRVAASPGDASALAFNIHTPEVANVPAGSAPPEVTAEPLTATDVSPADTAPTPTETDAPATEVPEDDSSEVDVPEGEGLRFVVTGQPEAEREYIVPSASTATRTDTRLLDVPQSIQVIPEAILDDQQVTSLDEALRNVSGVAAYSSEGAGFRFSLRGFQGARILRDGFSLSDSGTLSNSGILTFPELANVEQIEVLKGPASILYGEIQPGGVINLVTKQPTVDPFYEATLQVGNRGFIRPQLDFSDRLTADGSVRYRFNTLVQREDSFRDFDQAIERDFIAPVVTWDISDRTTLALDFEYFRDERPIDSGLLAFGDGVVDVPRDRIVGEPDDVAERDFYSIGYRLEHEFSDNWRLRHAFRYSNQDYNSTAFVPVFFDEASGNVTRFDSTTRWDQEYFGLQTDIVGRFETGSIAHTVLFGVDLSWNRSDIESRINIAAPSILNIFDPVYGTSPRQSFAELPNPARVQVVNTSRLGVFLQDQIDLTENLKFLAGIRYDTVSQDVDNDVSGFDPTGREVDQTVDAFTPRLGLVYQPIPELALYASYSQSFTPSSATNLAGDLLEPETGEGFEIGLKTELFDQRLIATLAYFDITKQNVATLDPDAPAFANAAIATGEERSQGIELDLIAEILPGWNLIANYAYTDARVTADNAIPTGNGLTGIPEHSASVWTTYTLQQGNLAGLGFGLGLNYVGDRPGDLDNSFELDDYLITNAAIFYERDRFQLALNFKNIFDINYVDGIPISRVRGIEPGEPFTIIGSLSFQF